MAKLPAAGELSSRVTIKLWADAPNTAFSLGQSFTDPVTRWTRIRPVGAMVHYGSKQTGDGVMHYIDMRRGSKTLPELMTRDKVIEHKGRPASAARVGTVAGELLSG